MKTFLHIFKRILNEKYPDINCTKNVHMGLNCSILTLREHDQIISDIEEIWLLKGQDTKFKFVIPQLIHAPRWKFGYIIFRKNTDC